MTASTSSPSPSPSPTHSNEPPCGCQCVPCASPKAVPAGCASSPTGTGNTVHLNSGRFAFELPSLGLSHLSDVTAGEDVPLFESKQQARMVRLTDGGGDPDAADVAVVNGQFNTIRYLFSHEAAGTVYYRDADGATGVLTKNTANHEFVLRSPHHEVTRFHGFNTPGAAPGRLKGIRSTDGHEATYAYQQRGSQWLLSAETDAYGRATTYGHTLAAGRYVLSEVTDHVGRRTTLQYDAAGLLVAVVGPAVTRGANGNANAFPGGRAYVLRYDTSGPQPRITHVYFPKQVAPHLHPVTRVVDAAAVYAQAMARHVVTYGNDPADPASYGRVTSERIGDGGSVGGNYTFAYQQALYGPALPAGVSLRTTMTDRNGNVTVHDFDAKGNRLRLEVRTNRNKSSKNPASFVTTWRFAAEDNLLMEEVRPEGDSTTYTYDDGWVRDPATRAPLFHLRGRVGFRLTTTWHPGPRGGEQALRTERGFYDPVFNKELVYIEPRGNPIDGTGTYYAPQNGGTTPTNADRGRYARWTRYDYEEDGSDANKAALGLMLGISPAQFNQLLAWQDKVLKDGGLPQGYVFGLDDVNGDGRTDQRLGNPVKVIEPPVALIPGSNQALVEGSATQQSVRVYTYNDRGQVTTETDPEGNVTAYVRYPEKDPEGDGQNVSPTLGIKQYGLLKETHVDVNPAEVDDLIGTKAVGDPPTFALKVPRRNAPGAYQNLVTRYAYDRDGNATAVTDSRGQVTTYDFNELGRAYRTTAPAPFGHRTETYYDEHGNVVRVDTEDRQAAPLSDEPASPDFMRPNVTLSADGRTASFATRAGPGGPVRPGWFTDRTEHDFLDRAITDDRDATGSSPARLVTRFTYDRNGNRVREVRPEGNTLEWDRDERGLVIAHRAGGNDPAVAAVAAMAYDRNGNLVRRLGAGDRDGSAANNDAITIADAFGSGVGLTHTADVAVEFAYDGYGRVTQVTDAAGGTTSNFYDPAGNVVRTEVRGTIGGATPTDRAGSANVLLARTLSYYDELGRRYESQQDVFIPGGVTLGSGRAVTHAGGGLAHNAAANGHTTTVTLTAGGESYVLGRTEHDRASRVAFQVADNGGVTKMFYDGVGRTVKTVDALGNAAEQTYDAGGSVVETRRTDRCQIATVADEAFVARYAYDALGRLVRTENQGADGDIAATADNEVALADYDSRGLATHAADALGNTAVSTHDGAGRLVRTEQHLRAGGTGSGAINATKARDGIITTVRTLDGNSRLTRLTDDNGNATLYAYDALDRLVSTTYADGSTHASVYSRDSDVVSHTDANGSVFTSTFDALGRRTAVAIARATGVEGTTAQAFQYDGAGRLTFCRDSTGSAHADAAFAYDALGRVLEETQTLGGDAKYVTRDRWIGMAEAGFVFPNGRSLDTMRDVAYRRTNVADRGGASIASWSFVGDRVAECGLGNGITCSFLNDARTRAARQPGAAEPAWGDAASDRLGYDGLGRAVAKRFLRPGSGSPSPSPSPFSSPSPSPFEQLVVGFTTAYDKGSRKQFERHLHAESRSHRYDHDSADRLTRYTRGTLATGGASVASPIALPGADAERGYELDGLGNWDATGFTPVGGSPATEQRTHNAVNQITLAGATALAYDHGNNTGVAGGRGNGNLADDGTRLLSYDALNRLTTVRRKSDAATVAQYAYDAANRRVRKAVSNGGVTGTVANGATRYLYAGWQCAEERGGTNAVTRQYVWGTYIDELVQQREYPSGASLYPLADLHYRTTALTDAWGGIVEAYDYDAYGRTLLFAGPGPDGTWFTADDDRTGQPRCEHLFQGGRYQPETGLYHFRNREYHPTLGRWIQRDRVGYADGTNLFQFVSSRVIELSDPLGLVGAASVPMPGGGWYNAWTGETTPPGKPYSPPAGPWNSANFIDHYFLGGGAAVDLQTIGLLDKFQQAPDVVRRVSQFKDLLTGRMENEAKKKYSAFDGKCYGNQVFHYSDTLATVTDVTSEGHLYSIGRSTFSRAYEADLTMYCCEPDVVGFSYSATLTFGINDLFEEPLRLPFELPLSTIYGINASWSIELHDTIPLG